MSETCQYCAIDERVLRLMVPVCELPHTRVYLYRENTFPGRCVVVWKEHVRKLTELTLKQRRDLMDDVGLVADTVTELYHPDKLNYLILGDESPHFHVHVVPKYKDTPQWGKMFEMMPEPSQFMASEEEYAAAAERLRAALLKKQGN